LELASQKNNNRIANKIEKHQRKEIDKTVPNLKKHIKTTKNYTFTS